MVKCLIIISIGREIKPKHICRLSLVNTNFWHIFMNEINHVIDITFYILKQLLQPLLPLLHSRFGCNLTKDISKIYLRAVDKINIFFAQIIIGNDNCRSSHSCKVKGLTRRMSRDAILLKLLANTGKRHMFISRKDQIAMNLIGEDNDIISQTNIT